MFTSCAASLCCWEVPILINSSKYHTAQHCYNSLQQGMLPVVLQEDSSDDLEEESEDEGTTSDDSDSDSMTVATAGQLSGSSLIAVYLDLQGNSLHAAIVCNCIGCYSAPLHLCGLVLYVRVSTPCTVQHSPKGSVTYLPLTDCLLPPVQLTAV